MRTRIVLATILVAALAGFGLYTWLTAPTTQAREAAHRFWLAVVDGETEVVESMLAAEADFSASEVIEANRDLGYGGRYGGDRPQGHVNWVKGPTETGTEVLVISTLRNRADGVPLARPIAMKRENGVWKVTRQGISFSY